jgi:electron transfer flavoprotein alpha subunit
MLRTALRPIAAPLRTFSALQQSRFASSLVFLEHKGGKLNDSSLSAVTAAKQVDANVRIGVQL